ncbi:MAG: bifunctional folylpolyglutamate synthase/dihydrofolate synthase [Nanoarchaeota archaeon]|nr:bifunctional folylpolyglutamate synthase/dihydrofolate synthase [Nanoarchaeota archaeon]
MEYEETINYLKSLGAVAHRKTFHLRLDNVRKFMDKLGNPEQKLSIIHVAGTNGKGSVCSMLTSILLEAGYTVGTNNSPHIWDFTERFLINGKKMQKRTLIKLVSEIKKHITKESFFEVTTALAIYYFAKRKVDFVVLETGLGGRLDATNIVNPVATVITSIAKEHTAFLGNTIAKIAREKAGIIKQEIPIITGTKGVALKTIKKIASQHAAPCYEVTPPKKVRNLKLRGSHQQHNAAIAAKVITVLNQRNITQINKADLEQGLQKASFVGRMQFLEQNLLLDGAHNAHAMSVLAHELKKAKKEYKNIILVMGILKDKDVEKMCKIINPLISQAILTKPNIDRAKHPRSYARFIKKQKTIILDVKEAVKEAKRRATKQDLIVVTGSLYVLAEVR